MSLSSCTFLVIEEYDSSIDNDDDVSSDEEIGISSNKDAATSSTVTMVK